MKSPTSSPDRSSPGNMSLSSSSPSSWRLTAALDTSPDHLYPTYILFPRTLARDSGEVAVASGSGSGTVDPRLLLRKETIGRNIQIQSSEHGILGLLTSSAPRCRVDAASDLRSALQGLPDTLREINVDPERLSEESIGRIQTFCDSLRSRSTTAYMSTEDAEADPRLSDPAIRPEQLSGSWFTLGDLVPAVEDLHTALDLLSEGIARNIDFRTNISKTISGSIRLRDIADADIEIDTIMMESKVVYTTLNAELADFTSILLTYGRQGLGVLQQAASGVLEKDLAARYSHAVRGSRGR